MLSLFLNYNHSGGWEKEGGFNVIFLLLFSFSSLFFFCSLFCTFLGFFLSSVTTKDYSDTDPGFRRVLLSVPNPFVPSGPFGCRMTSNLGPLSSNEIVLSLLISLSGRACTSLKFDRVHYCSTIVVSKQTNE